jgi:hypothetical protein
MTAEAVNVPQPKNPVHAMTTYELRNYRRELEHALKVLPEHVPARELLQAKHAEVVAEQDSRARIASGKA